MKYHPPFSFINIAQRCRNVYIGRWPQNQKAWGSVLSADHMQGTLVHLVLMSTWCTDSR